MTNPLVICLLVAPLPNMAFGYDVGSVGELEINTPTTTAHTCTHLATFPLLCRLTISGGVLDSIEDALGLTTFETELMIAQYYLGGE